MDNYPDTITRSIHHYFDSKSLDLMSWTHAGYCILYTRCTDKFWRRVLEPELLRLATKYTCKFISSVHDLKLVYAHQISGGTQTVYRARYFVVEQIGHDFAKEWRARYSSVGEVPF